jgi:hypothetical protein
MQGRSSCPANEGAVASARFSPQILLKLIVQPIAALDEIRESARWVEAYIFTAACSFAAFVLTIPASKYYMATMPTGDVKNSTVGSAPIAFAAVAILSFIGPPITWIVEAAVLQIAVRIGRGETSLRRLYALVANAGVPASIGALIVGIGVHAQDPAKFHSAIDLPLSIPITLAVLLHRTPQEALFFSSYGIFNIWSYVLVAIGLVRGAKLSPLVAALTMLAISLGLALARSQFS